MHTGKSALTLLLFKRWLLVPWQKGASRWLAHFALLSFALAIALLLPVHHSLKAGVYYAAGYDYRIASVDEIELSSISNQPFLLQKCTLYPTSMQSLSFNGCSVRADVMYCRASDELDLSWFPSNRFLSSLPPSALEIFSGLSFSVARGDFVSLTGPSGCGKSTLLKTVAGLVKPASGKVRVGNVKVDSLCDREGERYRNQTLGFVFQDYRLVDCFNVLKNVMTPALISGESKKSARARAEDLLNEVGLLERAMSYPRRMSGGEQQRVAIARALMNDPELILADEPTGNLDHAARDSVLLLFKKMNEAGKTVILVTHDDAVAAFSKRAILFDELKSL